MYVVNRDRSLESQSYLCLKVEQAKTQFELYIQISDTTKSRGPIFSTFRNVSPQIRSSIIQGSFLHSLLEIQTHTGILFSYVNTIHPETPVVCGTLK